MLNFTMVNIFYKTVGPVYVRQLKLNVTANIQQLSYLLTPFCWTMSVCLWTYAINETMECSKSLSSADLLASILFNSDSHTCPPLEVPVEWTGWLLHSLDDNTVCKWLVVFFGSEPRLEGSVLTLSLLALVPSSYKTMEMEILTIPCQTNWMFTYSSLTFYFFSVHMSLK